MYAKYNNNIYRYLHRKEYDKIITYDRKKSDATFYVNESVYVKQIKGEDPALQEVFDVTFSFNWDSKLEHVETTWTITAAPEYLQGDQLLLRYTKGLLPGWKVEEQTVCVRYVPIEECSEFKICYTYFVKNGEHLEKIKKEEKLVERSHFIETVHMFQNP